MRRCVLKGVEITEDNDSKAHIIASALGGRLKPSGILSRLGNEELDANVEDPYIKAFQPYMTLLDGSRDRSGSPGAVQMTGNDGRRYKVGPDGLRALDHEYTVGSSADGRPEVTIRATNMKQSRQLIARAIKELNL